MTVLVSYIPTREGWAALSVGTEQAVQRHTPIVILNVALDEDCSDPAFADEKDLDGVRAALNDAGLSNTICQVTNATDVSDAVLQAADDHGADLIVVGLRSRSPVAMAILGSNAQRISASRWEMLRLVYEQGLTQREVARRLHVREVSVRRCVADGLRVVAEVVSRERGPA